MYNEKQKICKIFVVQDGSPAVLGMQDIDKLSLISFNCETTHRQVVTDDIIDNRVCKSLIQIESGKCEQFEGEKQDEEPQSQQNTDNTLSHLLLQILGHG